MQPFSPCGTAPRRSGYAAGISRLARPVLRQQESAPDPFVDLRRFILKGRTQDLNQARSTAQQSAAVDNPIITAPRLNKQRIQALLAQAVNHPVDTAP